MARLGNSLVEGDYTNVSYQIDVVKKLPAPIQNVSDAIGMLQAAALPAQIKLANKVALYAGDVFDILHVPSDITVSGKLTLTVSVESKAVDLGRQAPPDLSSTTFTNWIGNLVAIGAVETRRKRIQPNRRRGRRAASDGRVEDVKRHSWRREDQFVFAAEEW